jgi:serine O-acetyltransferase
MFTTLRGDIQVVINRDPAASGPLDALLFSPGMHALWLHRISHWFWTHRLSLAGRAVSHFSRWCTGIEIHPGAKIGSGFFIDHGMGTVIGETADIGNNVTLYHNVTLGGVSWKKTKRHPTVEDHVVVGAGAQILGPIRIGARSRVGANAVVVKDVPPGSVVVGVPGRTSSMDAPVQPLRDSRLRHDLIPDPRAQVLNEMVDRMLRLEQAIGSLHLDDDLQTAANWASEIVDNGSHI